jgi:integrase
MPKTPSYRARRGESQAIVTLTDSATKRRRDYRLGVFGTPESREMYHRIIAEWEANGRQWPRDVPRGSSPTVRSGGVPMEPTVTEVAIAYWRWVESGHGAKRASNIQVSLRLLRRLDGTTAAVEYGPKRLLLLREAMARGEEGGDEPRRPWSRRTTNDRVRIVVAMFRCAVARELLPEHVYRALTTVEPLKRWRDGAKDPVRVTPVSDEAIEATRPHMRRQVRALVDQQLLTGARPGELLGLRAVDLETDGPDGVWTYRPRQHKNAHRGHERVIVLGPRAQAVIAPFLAGRAIDVPLFSPAEAEADRLAAKHESRTTPLKHGNRPGTNRKAEPRRRAGESYTTGSYRRAIAYACDAAFPPPTPLAKRDGETDRVWMARLSPDERARLREWQKARRWRPNQLRHTAATRLRREHGLEIAQLVLGHSSAELTDAVYAQRDIDRVVWVMCKIG